MAQRTLWLDSFFNVDVVSGSFHAQNLMTGFTEDAARIAQMTLTRTIIGLDLAYTVHDSGEGSQLVSVGTGIIGREAFDTPAANPDPVDLGSYPPRGWVFRAGYRVFGFAADQPAVYLKRVDQDIRSQRKLESGVSWMRVNNLAIEGVASTIRVTGIVRQLWIVS